MSAVTPFNRNNIELFQPNQIGGLALWLDAADTATVVTSGANVTQWRDKSGNKYDATAFGTPTYVNNAVNNLSAVRFNGTSSYFSIPGNQLDIASEDFAVFAVVQYTLKPASPIPIIGKGVGSSAVLQWRLSFDPNSIFQIVIFKNSVSIQSSATYTSAGWTLFGGLVYRATNTQAFTNGTGLNQVSSSPIIGSLSDTATNVEIGRGWGGTSFFNSDMGEILLYKGTITASQRQQIESYLAYKWNLQSSLPTTHPYYNSPYNAYPPFTNINQTIKFAYPVLPSDVGGLALWLDAADGATLFQNTAGTTPVTNGSQIQLWKDKSSSANNATNSQTVMTYNGNGLNSLPAISFPGTQTTGFSLSGALLPNGSSDATYFFVLNKNNAATQVFFTHGGATQLKQFYAGGSLSIDRSGVPLINDGTSIINLNTIVSCTETSLTNGVNGWRNGNPFSSTGATITWNVDTTAAWLGSGGVGGGTFQYAGVISEVIVYRTALTATQRQQIESYLAYKWNLQTNLPVTHPYYKNAFIPNLNQTVPTTIISYIYSPRSISGLALWLDAADSATVIRTGANVTGWNDKSGNNNNGTAFGTGSPTYSSNSIAFTGGQAFSTTLSSVIPNQSGFAVVNYKSATKIHIISLTRTSGTAGIQQIILNNVPLITTYGGTTIVTGGTLTQNTILLYNYTFGATTNAFIYTNGSQTATTTGPYSLTGTGTVNIGGYDNLGEGFIGSMNEILLFNVVLTTNQRQQVEGYLAWKWGLQKSLPSNHPFYLFPPG